MCNMEDFSSSELGVAVDYCIDLASDKHFIRYCFSLCFLAKLNFHPEGTCERLAWAFKGVTSQRGCALSDSLFHIYILNCL